MIFSHILTATAVIVYLVQPASSFDILSQPVVDTHVHLVDLAQGFNYSWSEQPTCHQDCGVCSGTEAKPPCNVYRTWTVQDYLMAQSLNTTDIVFMEVSTATTLENPWGEKEAKWIQHLAETTEPKIKGIVAHCFVEAGAAVEPCLAEVSGLKLVRGIRSGFPHTNGTCDPTFVEGIKLLAKYRLHFEVLGGTSGLAAAYELASSVPDVNFVLDHLAGPVISNATTDFPVWSAAIAKLATLPNVYMKISGGPQQAGGPGWTIDEVKPYVLEAIKQFGHTRSFYAGNWFWVNNYSNLARWSTALYEIVRDVLSDNELQDLFYNTGKAFYRLE